MTTSRLDHLVHLTPPGSLDTTAQQFRDLGFNVIPGGTHADGLTANSLVVFSDGVYLELICFVKKPEGRELEHRWSRKDPGWIDFAFHGNGLSNPPDRISDIISKRAASDASGTAYLPEVAGGRLRPDGEELKWLITTPAPLELQGPLPFFCGDVTPFERRVPVDPISNAEHPNNALGIAHVRILVSPENHDATRDRFSCVLGHVPTISSSKSSWNLETYRPLPRGSRSKLVLDIPSNPEETQFLFSAHSPLGSIYEIGIYTTEEKSPRSITTPYGKIVWIVLSQP